MIMAPAVTCQSTESIDMYAYLNCTAVTKELRKMRLESIGAQYVTAFVVGSRTNDICESTWHCIVHHEQHFTGLNFKYI